MIGVLVGSCSNLKTKNSRLETYEVVSSSEIFPFYDTDSEVFYKISNDQDHLVIRLKTSNQNAVRKMTELGLTFYFDIKGHKGKKTYIKYPLKQNRQGPHSMNDLNLTEEQKEKLSPPEIDFNSQFEHISDEAIFCQDEIEEHIQVNANPYQIKTQWDALDNHEILLTLSIPQKILWTEKTTNLDKLSIGVVSGFSTSSDQENNRPPMGSNNGQQGPPPSGQSGGMGGPPSGGGGGPGGQKPNGNGPQNQMEGDFMNSTSMTTPIDFWFKVNLYTN